MRGMKTAESLPSITPNRRSIMKTTSPQARFKFPQINDLNSFQMKSLNKHIRNNEVDQILKESKSAVTITKNTDDIQKDEVKETSINLLYLRKKFDEVRETCIKKEQEMNKMRAETEKLKEKENSIADDSYNAHTQFEQLKHALEIQKLNVEEAHENSKIYAHMLDRLKKDKISDQMKVANLEQILNKEIHELNTETQDAKKAKQFEIQTRIVFDNITRQVEVEDKKRQESLNVFEKTLTAQEEADKKRNERILRNQLVAENALTELKDSNENRWRDVQLVHRFLNFFLKRKIEREIRQYEAVEKAYQKIKASTGLSDTREIVNKFVTREQTYSELLISIADYEKKIADLRKTNESLKTNIQSLKEKNMPQERQREDKVDLYEVYKKLGTSGEVYKQTKLMVEKTHSWVMQNLIKLDKARKVLNKNYYEMYPKENLADAFIKVIEIIKNDLSEVKEQDVEKVLDEIDKTKIDQEIRNDDFMSKNVRVKPSQLRSDLHKQAESPALSRRSFQAHEEGSDHEDGTQEEQESMDLQRTKIKNKAIEDAIKAKKLQEKKEKEEAGR